MDNLIAMIGVGGTDRIRNKRISKLVYEYIKRIDKNRIVKSVFESQLTGVRKVGRPCKIWIDSGEKF